MPESTSVSEEPFVLATSFSSSVDLDSGMTVAGCLTTWRARQPKNNSVTNEEVAELMETIVHNGHTNESGIYSVVSPQLSTDARRGQQLHRRSTSATSVAAGLYSSFNNHIAFRTDPLKHHRHAICLDIQQPRKLVFNTQTLKSCYMNRMARQTPAALDVATVPEAAPELTKQHPGRKRTLSKNHDNSSRPQVPQVVAIDTSAAALQGGATGAGFLATPTDSNTDSSSTMAKADVAKWQASPTPPTGTPKEGRRQSPQSTFCEDGAYLTGAWAGDYCTSENTTANDGDTERDKSMLRRVWSQSSTTIHPPSPRTSPTPAAMASQSLPLLTAAAKNTGPPTSQYMSHKMQKEPPAAPTLATPPLTASVPNSADASHQSPQMHAVAYVQPSTQKPPSPRSSNSSRDALASTDNIADDVADHQPEGGFAETQSRPMSTILMVAATEENSGDTTQRVQQEEQTQQTQQAQQAQQRESNWFRRQTKSSSLKRPSGSAVAPSTQYEARLLRAQQQRDAAMTEAAELQRHLDELQRTGDAEIARLREEVAAAGQKLRAEYELRTAAEAKCSMMECELAELSSNIQYEAQNLVAQERRAHKGELERAARKHREVVQLMEMERAQVGALKLSLERETAARDSEHAEADRLRSALAAIERQMSPASLPRSASAAERKSRSGSRSASPTAVSLLENDAHISGRMLFGCDVARPDLRLGEFIAFVDAASEKEALASAFMQRSLREDVEPTLAADAATSALPSLSGWSRHRRLLHSALDATLELESYTPRVAVERVVSPACYLCSCSVTRAVPRVSTDASAHAHGAMFRMRLGADDADSKPLCAHCHTRMMAVCSFFAYLRIVRRRLTRRPIAEVWLEVNRARLHMWLVRSGASPDCQLRIEHTD
ncbi:hypothetical protein COEREDRAFT_13408 [Coemansia reversa NRRL 1564]|uniref:GDP/GTP exchange factor Sec2 N-terminal domain-containing protein n=1 Tax=Coemansia reversa (strain ATCC 12441 / NRRL 1564) TaxID=763665 RepID=A0A2G5BIH7_COERN|nr:hypothetical protein COEREDRAFT_13408 [Coemansia reversa NRRL 1564]|eukprot:PIA18799.1 hypothetical protein COEREDRAFT_13408 [Coemansia reversa NRRL 1564]